MFTGIIEDLGKVVSTQKDGGNLVLRMKCGFTNELKPDQSLAHNGVCLTVVTVEDDSYTVVAIEETLRRTNIGLLRSGDLVNLERCLRAGARLDGHIVQGHVDTTGVVERVTWVDGSHLYEVKFADAPGHIAVQKGSICINGVSLTVVDSVPGQLSVAIIPYTYEHTTFHKLQEGDRVNLEFDILGKYIEELVKRGGYPVNRGL